MWLFCLCRLVFLPPKLLIISLSNLLTFIVTDIIPQNLPKLATPQMVFLAFDGALNHADHGPFLTLLDKISDIDI
jgi:hypothetical protein